MIEEDDLFHLWDTQYHQQKPGQRTRLSDPIINRINPFYANPYLYPSLCHPDCLNFSQLINENRIVLISLRSNSEVVPHKEQHFVGSLLVSLIQMVGMNRQEGSEPYYVYVDEIQNLVTSSLDVIFSQAAKFGVFFIVANQYLGQLEAETYEAIMGNVGATVAFRVGLTDVSNIAKTMQPQFSEPDLLALPKYQAAIKAQYLGTPLPAFELFTLDVIRAEPEVAEANERRVRAKSVQNFHLKTRDEVMNWLEERYSQQTANCEAFPPKTPIMRILMCWRSR